MKLNEVLSQVEKELKVEYHKDQSGKIIARYNSRSMSLDEFEKLANSDPDVRALIKVTMEQNKYYQNQTKKFEEIVLDLFHQKTKTPDIEVDKGKVVIHSGRKITTYSSKPRIDTKEIKSSGSKDLTAPPWLRKNKES